MRLAEIMSENVQTITADQPVQIAWQRMRSQRIHHLVVVDGQTVLGVVSERDLGLGREGATRSGQLVGDIMSRDPVLAHPTHTVREAANLLRGHTIGCLPIIDRSRLVGIVTVSDLLELIGRGTEKPVVRAKRWTLKHRGPRHVSSGTEASHRGERRSVRGKPASTLRR